MSPRRRRAKVMFGEQYAGLIEETDGGYRFTYDPDYLKHGRPLSLSLPLASESYISKKLFPFFRGLLPEGWYREIAGRTLKIDEEDEFGLLTGTCKDCIGAVWITEGNEHDTTHM